MPFGAKDRIFTGIRELKGYKIDYLVHFYLKNVLLSLSGDENHRRGRGENHRCESGSANV